MGAIALELYHLAPWWAVSGLALSLLAAQAEVGAAAIAGALADTGWLGPVPVEVATESMPTAIAPRLQLGFHLEPMGPRPRLT